MDRNTCRKPPIFPLLAAAGSLFYWFFIRPQLRKWGTRLGESQRRLPGDDLIPQPNLQSTMAINIDAPAEAVWPWLAQMGRNRTGWYGGDLLINNGIPSATYIRKDVEPLQVGMTLDPGLHVVDLQPNRMLLISGYDLPNLVGTSTDITILYLLERRSDGSTRLLVRLRGYSYGLAGILGNVLLEFLDFAVSYQQLNGLKSRAETMAHLNLAVPLEE